MGFWFESGFFDLRVGFWFESGLRLLVRVRRGDRDESGWVWGKFWSAKIFFPNFSICHPTSIFAELLQFSGSAAFFAVTGSRKRTDRTVAGVSGQFRRCRWLLGVS